MKKEYDFSKLKRAEPKYLRHLKEPVTIRLGPQNPAGIKCALKKFPNE